MVPTRPIDHGRFAVGFQAVRRHVTSSRNTVTDWFAPGDFDLNSFDMVLTRKTVTNYNLSSNRPYITRTYAGVMYGRYNTSTDNYACTLDSRWR
ncbi:hypothetical protein [Spirosoma fluminis]